MGAFELKAFTYWEGPEGGVQQMCRQSVTRFFGNAHVHHTAESVIEDVPTLPRHIAAAKAAAVRADYYRVRLLEKYGGFWFDSDILLVRDPCAAVETRPKIWTTNGSYRSNAVLFFPLPRHPVAARAARLMEADSKIRGWTWGMTLTSKAFAAYTGLFDIGPPTDFHSLPDDQRSWREGFELYRPGVVGIHLWWSSLIKVIPFGISAEQLVRQYPRSVFAQYLAAGAG